MTLEGASAIVYRDVARAPELAARQRIGAGDLAADRIVDCVITERSADREPVLRRPWACPQGAIEALANQEHDTRMAERLRRYRYLGLAPDRQPLRTRGSCSVHTNSGGPFEAIVRLRNRLFNSKLSKPEGPCVSCSYMAVFTEPGAGTS